MSEVMNAPVEAGSEPIAVEPNPINVDNVDHEAEVKSPEQDKAKPEPKGEEKADKPRSTREALEKAVQKLEAEQKAEEKQPAKTEEKPKEKAASERDETGKFKAKEADQPKTGEEVNTAAKPEEQPKTEATKSPHSEAPARFSREAKAEWAAAPEHVRAETHRAMRELETGIQEHQKRWEPVSRYDEMAKQYGTSLPDALERYVAFDMDLNNDLVGGLDRIVRDKTGGEMGLKDVIAKITGQKPDEAQSQSDAVIHSLRQEVADLKKAVGGVTGHLKGQAEQSAAQQVTKFAEDKPDFDALAGQIALHIGNGLSLEQAYEQAKEDARQLAEKLGFIPKPAETAAADLTPAPSAQTDKGTKSIAGAPSAGSAPVTEKPSSSVRDAVRRAMQRA